MKLSEARSKFGKRRRPATRPVAPPPKTSEPPPDTVKPDTLRDKGLSWAREGEAGLTTPDPPRTKPGKIAGKVFRFSGRLSSWTRADAMDAVTKQGGWASAKPVNENTDYLVVGDTRKMTSKVRRCHDMQARGHRIRMIDEAEFEAMLRG